MRHELLLGAVAYDPSVVTIWEGFRQWFRVRGFPFDYVLFSNYERQVNALFAGMIDVAWNSPLAWVRCELIAEATGREVRAIAMRDTDLDVTSVIIVRSESRITSLEQLRGRTVAVGAFDSPQATLLPLALMRRNGLEPDRDFSVLRHEILAGLHGDHVGGERDAARALLSGAADAAAMLRANYLAFIKSGLIPPTTTAVLAATPPYDHCNMTEGPAAPPELVTRFVSHLLEMSSDDPQLRPLLELEGLHHWCPARLEGYAQLREAVAQTRFYGAAGERES